MAFWNQVTKYILPLLSRRLSLQPSGLIGILVPLAPCSRPLSIPPLTLIFLRRNMDNAAPCPDSLRLAPKLVAIPLDVVQAIRNDDVALGDGSLNRREFFGPGSLLLSCAGIYLVSQTTTMLVPTRIVRPVCRCVVRVDNLDCSLGICWVCGDEGVEFCGNLLGAEGLA